MIVLLPEIHKLKLSLNFRISVGNIKILRNETKFRIASPKVGLSHDTTNDLEVIDREIGRYPLVDI